MTMDVAVIIAARNAAPTIEKAVASALAQEPAREVHVVDDASTDETLAAARRADDGTGRLRLHRLDVNRGPSGARNLALAQSACAYVCVLDADDYLLPGRLERLLPFAAEGVLAADDLIIVPPGAPATAAARLAESQARVLETLDLAGFVRGNVAEPGQERRELGYLKPLMSRAFLDKHGLRYREDMRLGEDFALYAGALEKGARLRLVSACGYVAVVHPTSLSHVHGAEDLAAVLRYDDEVLSAPLDPGAKAAFERHRRQTLRNLSHRRALDARRRGDWAHVAREVFRSADVFAYVLRETLRAKLGPARPPAPAQPRLLIGTVEAAAKG
ncbi:glycosyl transferase family A [Alsobacter soli]|uniref:Glycosyl transferase family A n=1 Tax=Alsobacter soli TaxID=2109933 RepID=A0A2T1HN92_9HYPH|nr:glycosyltransferase family 2 protein [Alsobacter soli]PSC03108.1 glycosyl transferase family A [Alsobacter soli]